MMGGFYSLTFLVSFLFIHLIGEAFIRFKALQLISGFDVVHLWLERGKRVYLGC